MKRESTEELRARLLADVQVQSMIAMRAYEIFELRGGTPGRETEDWFQAEAEILKFVIEEEIRRIDAHSPREESAAAASATAPYSGSPYDTIEKRMEIFASIETENAPTAEPLTRTAFAHGEAAIEKATTPEISTSPEASANVASPSKKAAGGLRRKKGSDKKASGKVKASKKSAKIKHSKQRSAEMEKHK